MITEVKPSDNNGYGYIEFTLDGTNYTGTYKTSTYLPYISGASHTYVYDLRMTESENMIGTKIYDISISYYNSNGQKTSRHISRAKGKVVRICSGEFDTQDGMVKFWKDVAEVTK